MVMELKRIIYACDIGTTRYTSKSEPSFAWARLNPEDGVIEASSHIDKLVEYMKLDIGQGISIALGFEAPLFIPVPKDWKNLSKGREGDGNRSFASPVGLTVCALGVHQSAWILKSLLESSCNKYDFTLDLQRWWPPQPSGRRPILFCWEAFVSGDAHAHDDDHKRDAATAAHFFFRNEKKLQALGEIKAESPVSLIGAVAIWSDWVTDLEFIHKSTLVIKPGEVFEGEYRNLDER